MNTATGVAGAVAINLSKPTAEATISGSVTATAATVTATVNGQTGVTANSGQGSTTVGVAGALALDLPGANSHADIAAGGSVVLTGKTGDVTVQATTAVTQDNATANARRPASPRPGSVPPWRWTSPSNGATAEVSGTVTSPDQLTVFASGSYSRDRHGRRRRHGRHGRGPALALAVTHNVTMALVGTAAAISAGADAGVRPAPGQVHQHGDGATPPGRASPSARPSASMSGSTMTRRRSKGR